MRGLVLSPAIGPVLHSVRVKVQGLFFKIKFTSAQGRVGPQAHKQFRMILSRSSPLHLVSRTLFTYPQKRFLDFEPLVWDKVILIINKRTTYDTTRKIRRFRNEAQEPARLRLWNDPAAARAGRPVRRGPGMFPWLARSLKLRDLYAAVTGTDGRGASSGGWRNGCYHSDQGTKVHGPQKEIQGSGLINRGLRAPSPQESYPQARAKIKSYPQGTGTSSGTSWASSSAQGTGRVGPQARKPSVTSSRIAEPGKSIGSL